MANVKIMSTVRKGFLMSLPGNIKLWGGEVKSVPEELLKNPGVQSYIKSGRLVLVNEPDARVPEEDKEAEAKAQAEAAEKAEKEAAEKAQAEAEAKAQAEAEALASTPVETPVGEVITPVEKSKKKKEKVIDASFDATTSDASEPVGE